ncbi:hypothetical protein ACJX0J_013205, partial [Zea mays]
MNAKTYKLLNNLCPYVYKKKMYFTHIGAEGGPQQPRSPGPSVATESSLLVLSSDLYSLEAIPG